MSKDIFFFGDISQTFINFRMDLVNQLMAEGHRVSCYLNLAEEHRKLLVSAGLKVFVHRLQNRNFSVLAIFKAFLNLFRFARRSNVIVSYFFVPNLLSLIFTSFYAGRTVCFVEGLGQLGVENLAGWRRFVLHVYACMLGRADAVIVLNQGDLARLLDLNTSLMGKIHLIQGIGVSTTHFVPSRIAYQSRKKNVVFIGRLLDQKGVRELIAVSKNFKDRSEVSFQFLGDYVESGDGISRDEAADIESHSGNVKFFGRVDVLPFLERADLVCLPTRYGEGMPRVLLEAMACGTVVVTSNVSGCVELVEHGVTGFVFEREVPDGLINCLSECLDLPTNVLMDVRYRARLSIEERFSNNVILPKFIELIVDG